MKAKYKITRKKVVSKLLQRADGINRFLESLEELWLPITSDVCPYFSMTLYRQTYEIFMNRSGLSDGHFAMLMLAVGRIAIRRP